MKNITLKECDRIEILTLQDNYVDLLDSGSNEIVHRAAMIRGSMMSGSIIAEHGFSALVKTASGETAHTLLMDFGYSALGVRHNMDMLGVDAHGIERVHAVIGGFHLSGLGELIIEPTIAELKRINPDYVIPCHCTGRKAVMATEREFPGFLLNMSGTTLTFNA
jgi:metal-dependent hydrolase (beta-lactamase superfamily II)